MPGAEQGEATIANLAECTRAEGRTATLGVGMAHAEASLKP